MKKLTVVVFAGLIMAEVSAFGAVTVSWDETGIVYDIPAWTASESHETTTARLAWPDKTITDIVAIKGTVCGGWIGEDFVVDGLIYDRTDASFKVQFQALTYGKIKVVRAECAQTAEGVTIKLTGACLSANAPGQVLPESAFGGSTPIGASGYGVRCVEAYGDVHEIDAFPAPASGGITVNGGTLLVKLSSDVSSSVPISGNGRLWFAVGADPVAREEAYTEASLPANGSWVTVLSNVELKDVELIGGDMIGGWVDTAAPACVPYNATPQPDGSVIVQLQRLSWGAARCVRVQLRQQGPNIQAKGIDSFGQSNTPLGGDATSWTKNTGYAQGGYVISALRFSRTGPWGVTLRGEKGWKGGLKVEGVRLNVNDHILPDHSRVNVLSGGILQLSAANAYDHYPLNVYVLDPGTQLWLDAFDAVNCGDEVIADAAAIKVISENSSYLNNLTLKNGASLSGFKVRVGNTGAAVWRTLGELPIEVSCSIETVRHLTSNLTFDIGADMRLTGRIYEFTGRERMPLVKTGCTALTFGNSVTTTSTLTLNGGAVTVNEDLSAAGLILGDDSLLTVALGKSVLFGDSSELAWVEGKLLTLEGAFGKSDRSLRIGTTADGLTRTQVQSIRIGGLKGRLDDEGWIHRNSSGMVIVVS